VHSLAAEGAWTPSRLQGYVCRDTRIAANTDNVAGVRVYRRGTGDPAWCRHDADILFTYLMDGTLTLEGEGREPYDLVAGDAFGIPPGMKTRLADPSGDVEFLEVTLPGRFTTVPAS
jgi:quercetin dioxygenase-like cupin family protein